MVHYLRVILVWKQMPTAIHRDLERSVSGERLHRLGREARINPT
jgi:hypothetical protein